MNNRKDQGVYEGYYTSIEYSMINSIRHSFKKIKMKCVTEKTEIHLHITPLLERITIPSLILEMNLCHQFGELSGETDTALYQSFVEECLCKEQWLSEFYTESPLLKKYIRQVIKYIENNLVELVRRFQEDQVLLNRILFADNPCSQIMRIDSADSDTHRGGQRVYILELDNGRKLVYKPRSLEIDVIFRDMMMWTADGIGIDYQWNRIVDRGEYGWCEWVDEISCENIRELERYYMRNGLLLALSYALGSSDFHYENLIAHGKYPVIIDLEMGVGRRDMERAGTADLAQELYRDSVLRTGLLPMFTWGENGEGINVGAINAAGGDLVPIRIPVIVQPGTINMHIEYARLKMKPAKNLATLNQQFVEPCRFCGEIKRGFELAYRFIMEHRTEMVRRVEKWKSTPVRFLANHTQVYSMLLSTSYLPKYMQDENERKQVLFRIKKRGGDNTADWIAEQEVEEMLRGDIPYFWYRIGETTLYSGNHKSYQNFFVTTAEAEIIHRLSKMNTENMEQQKRLIENALFIGDRGKGMSDKPEGDRADGEIQREGCKRELSLGIAKKVGDLLLEEAVWNTQKETVSWIGMMLAGFREMGYLIRPMGPYLYDGWAGVTLFAVKLARETGEQKHIELAEVLKRQLFRHTDQLSGGIDMEKRNSGAYTGEASVAYLYQLLYEQERDNQYLLYMEKQCAMLSQICRYDHNYDILGGNAGAILVLLNAFDMTGNQKYIRWAEQAGNYLINSATEYEWGGWGWIAPSIGKALTGVAHGASGIMYALARLGDYSGKTKYEEAAYRAFQFEMKHYQRDKKDWADLRFTDDQGKMRKYDTAWCHGWGGILMAVQATKIHVKGAWKEELENVAAKAEPRKRYQRGETSYSLCHGKLGNAALMYSMGERELGELRYQEIIQELNGSLKNLRERLGQQECENFGLMGGIAGIGYACLCGGEEVGRLLLVGIK